MASTNAPGGRFLPGDPRVEEPYRLTPQLAFRIAVLGFLALAVFAALFVRLWALQVLSGDRYLAQANDNRVRALSLEAPRGPIVDRSGYALVVNVPGTRVELWPADLPKNWPAERKELRALSMVTGVPVADMLAQLRRHAGDPLTPVVVQSGLHYDQVAYLAEHAYVFPGVRLAESSLRKYPYQSLAAQVLGYVGQISPQEYKQLKRSGYQPTDSIGQAGIESTYDTYLRGKDGKAELTVDSRGRPKSAPRIQVTPQPGETLRLTLDIQLQRAAERALTYGIHLAHSNLDGQHADGGAIVALDPTRRRRARDGLEPDLQAVGLLRSQGSGEARQGARQAGGDRQLPGAEPRDRRRLPAGLDLQAGDSARRDAGAADAAVRPDRVHADLHGVPAAVQELGRRCQPADGADHRRSPSRATRTSTASARRFYVLPADRGPHAAALGRTGSGFGSRHGHRHRARERRASCRRPSGGASDVQRLQVLRDRPHLEARLLGPAGDRPGQTSR